MANRRVSDLGLDDALDWIDVDGKVNVDILIQSSGYTEPGEIKKVKQELQNSRALEIIRDVIRKRYTASQATATSLTDPNWSISVAWHEGYRKALSDIYKSIPIRNLDRIR